MKMPTIANKKGIADVCSENLLESILQFEQGLEKHRDLHGKNPVKKPFSSIMDNVM